MIKDAHSLPHFIEKRKKRFVPFQKILPFQAILKEAIVSLPKEEQIMLALYYQEGLSFEEIGEVLSQTPEEIWEKFHALVNKIRKELNFLGTSLN